MEGYKSQYLFFSKHSVGVGVGVLGAQHDYVYVVFVGMRGMKVCQRLVGISKTSDSGLVVRFGYDIYILCVIVPRISTYNISTEYNVGD